jgi:hypothetical protein
MIRALLFLLLLAGATLSSPRARAFTLHGEIPAWFTDNAGLFPGDIYGPVNLGEEYRWSVPSIFYAFDESFLNYFGEKGVEEVEKAVAILNALPRMSDIDINAYPTHSQRVNHRARDLSLLDLKSYALKHLVEQLGLATPARFVYTLRGRDPQTAVTNYLVMMRNFDPETWIPTPFINGQLWTYTSIYDNQDAVVKSAVLTEPVDPLILAEPVASVGPGFAQTVFGLGSFFTGLTRDDVGGLRYLYRPENRNNETLPADALTGATGVGGGGAVIGGGGGGAWVPIISTNDLGAITGGGGAWTPIQPPTTNTATGGVGTGGGFVPVSEALRGGIDKILFARGPSVFVNGQYALAHRFTESIVYITNGISRSVNQQVTRILTAPDILFTAADLAATDTTSAVSARGEGATSNDAINGSQTLDGPGQIAGPIAITFNKVGPTLFNSFPSFLGEANGFLDFVWGSFDGSTNDPVVYPVGSTIRDLERTVFGSR